jgi:cytochrome b561
MTNLTQPPDQFPLSMRILHWLMASMVLAMLFIGVAMVTSFSNYHRLIAIHRPLGIAIGVLVIVRLANRLRSRLPLFPPEMSEWEKRAATTGEVLLYILMLALPIVGWAMLSAGNYPIVLLGPVHLPPILKANPILYAALRKTHTLLAYAMFFVFLAHMTAVLFHSLILRDRLLERMTSKKGPNHGKH